MVVLERLYGLFMLVPKSSMIGVGLGYLFPQTRDADIPLFNHLILVVNLILRILQYGREVGDFVVHLPISAEFSKVLIV